MPANELRINHVNVVDSPANPLIKHIRSLTLKKNREATQSFFVEGLQASILALDAEVDLQAVLYSPALLTGSVVEVFLARCRQEGHPLVEVSERAFRRLSEFSQPSGVGVLARQRYSTLADLDAGGPLFLLALEDIQYAGNLGTILRTCDAAGVSGVVLLDRSVDPYSPEAVKASMGCIFTQRLARSNVPEFLAFCTAHRLDLIAATPEAALGLQDISPSNRRVLLLGSERCGLSPELRSGVKTQVSIPMRGKADSLNIAVAAGILIYQLLGGETMT